MSRSELDAVEVINEVMAVSAIAFIVTYSDYSHLILKRQSELLLKHAKWLTNSLVNDEGVGISHEALLQRYRQAYKILSRARRNGAYDEVTLRNVESMMRAISTLAKSVKSIKLERRVPTLDRGSGGRPMTISRMQDFVFNAYCIDCDREMASMPMPKLKDVIGKDIIWGGGELIVKCKCNSKHQTSVIGNYTRNAKHHEIRMKDVVLDCKSSVEV